jgi:RNA polymerase sigma-70 factor (ECF subfamily)
MIKGNRNTGRGQEESLRVFEDFFRLYYPRLKNYAHSFLHNSDEANDVVQDLFFQLWEDRKFLDSEQNIPAYVFTLLKNRCLNILKRRIVEEKYLHYQARLLSEELYHISFETSGVFVSMEESLHQELDRLIALMPEKCGFVFRMKWIEGKKNREIAEAMQISMTMVDKQLAKGMAIARENLNRGLLLLFVCFSKTKTASC